MVLFICVIMVVLVIKIIIIYLNFIERLKE